VGGVEGEGVYLVDEEDARDQFGDPLVNVAADYLIDFFSEFVCNFCLLGFHELAHHAHDILASLRSRIGDV